jgi:hypothetical protein
MPKLVAEMKTWAKEGPFVQRAAAAALCEPALLKGSRHTPEVLLILDGITESVAAATNRRDESFRVLRKALGYCWSVAAAAAPTQARPLMEKWLSSNDRDVAWIMKANLGKARMSALGKAWLAKQARPRATTEKKPAARPTPRPKSQVHVKAEAKGAARPRPARKIRTKR